MKKSSHTNGQGHFCALRKLGSAGLHHGEECLSFNTVARHIVSEASCHQSTARTLVAVAGIVCGVDGVWRNTRRFNSVGALVISEREAMLHVGNRVRLCAQLLYRMRVLGFFEPDTYACATLEGKAAEDYGLLCDINAATYDTDSLTLPQWFDAMEYLIGRGHAGPVLSPQPRLGDTRLVCRNTGADERPVRWDYADQ